MMLEKEQLLEAYEQLTNSCYPIWDWRFDEDFRVISSNCPHESLYSTLLTESGIRSALEKQMMSSPTPLIYMEEAALCWIAVFEKDFSTIYIKGPFFNSYNDPASYADILKGHHFSENMCQILQDSFSALPAINANEATRLALMLHQAVHQQPISEGDIHLRYTSGWNKDRSVETDQLQRTNTNWQIEDELLEKVKRGDMNLSGLLEKFNQQATLVSEEDRRNIDAGRQNINMLLSLVSRAAVEGGVPRKTSFALSGEYRRRIKRCTSMHELTLLSNEMLTEYIQRVNSMQKYRQCSKQIQLCCEYINNHPEEKLTLEYLANRVGYSVYHLSRKFRQEMGCTLVEYMQDIKIQRAQFLLRTTENTVEDIASQLHFGSSGYFTSVFHKKTGMPPSEYRKNYGII